MERLKGLDSKVLLRANMMGELSLGVETDLVFLNNVWTDLLPPSSGVYVHYFLFRQNCSLTFDLFVVGFLNLLIRRCTISS
jgi:hypothetical protein